MAFTIREGRLFTLRERELPAFRLYRMRVRNQTLVDGNAYELLLDLFETKIEQLADEIENIYSDTEKLSRVIMEGHGAMSTTKRCRRWRNWKISAGRSASV